MKEMDDKIISIKSGNNLEASSNFLKSHDFEKEVSFIISSFDASKKTLEESLNPININYSIERTPEKLLNELPFCYKQGILIKVKNLELGLRKYFFICCHSDRFEIMENEHYSFETEDVSVFHRREYESAVCSIISSDDKNAFDYKYKLSPDTYFIDVPSDDIPHPIVVNLASQAIAELKFIEIYSKLYSL